MSAPTKQRGIAVLETAIILLPLLFFILLSIGIIDYIRTGKIISRTLDEHLRSLNGKPYHFDSGAIVFNRTGIHQMVDDMVAGAYSAVVSQICGQEEATCPYNVQVEAQLQEIQIDTATGEVRTVHPPTTRSEWRAGSGAFAHSFEGAFDNYRGGNALLALPSGMYSQSFLPVTVLVGLGIRYSYPSNSITQTAMNLLQAGAAFHESHQVMMLRGDVDS